ncbi:MAG: FecR domain-containing protein [Anaerolineales bacterium]|nr:FecR domain-containing protein [Anaerolineales bacterium]
MSYPKRWPMIVGTAVILAAALAILAVRVASQDYGPQFNVEDCLCGQNSYLDDGHAAAQGILNCRYKKEEAGADLFQNWKSLSLYYYPTTGEAIASLEQFLTDEHLDRYLNGPPGDLWDIEFGLQERTDQSLYGYVITFFPPDREFGGEYGSYTGRPPHYYLERRFVHRTYSVLIFVNGELFRSLDEAMAEAAELEACAKNVIEEKTAGTNASEQPTALLPSPAEGEKRLGYVGLVVGRVQVQRPPDDKWIQLDQGYAIYSGDRIRTLEDGRVRFDLENGHQVRQESNGSVIIPSAIPKPEPEPSFLEILFGRLWLGIKGLRSGDRFQVWTSNSLAGIKGTEFEIIVEGESTIVNVFDGVVEVSDLDGTKIVNVNPGETSRCVSGGVPSDPEPFDLDSLDRWWEAFPEAAGPGTGAAPPGADQDGAAPPEAETAGSETSSAPEASTAAEVETASRPDSESSTLRIATVAIVILCGIVTGLIVLVVVVIIIRRT